MKTDETFWSDLRHLLSELDRIRPAIDAKPGKAVWLKRILLQLFRPLAVPQIDFDRHLTVILERMLATEELACDRINALEESNRQLNVAIEKLTLEIRNNAKNARPPAQPAPDSTERLSLQQALERGFFLQNVCPGMFNVLDEIENWDVLIVLDACRYDAFQRVWRQMPSGQLDGKLSKRISTGSHTVTWLKRTFSERDRDAERIVYLATNPHISKRYLERIGLSTGLAHIEELYQTCWDSRLRTVMPQSVTGEYLRLREQFPGKKFILHFLQPHTPYVGKTRLRVNQPDEMHPAINADGVPMTAPTELALIEDCQVSLAQGIQAYDDNLRFALDSITELLPKIDGRVAITADHGELFGEYGIYGHIEELYVPELIEVPWFVCG